MITRAASTSLASEMLADQQADYGADGRAAQVRPSRIRTVAGEWQGSARQGRPVEVRQFEDSALFDRMWRAGQLSDGQHATAARLAGLWTAAGLNPRGVCRYGEGGGASLAADPDAPTPRDRYRRLMRQLSGQEASALESMFLDRHPGAWRLEILQGALDRVGDLLDENSIEAL